MSCYQVRREISLNVGCPLHPKISQITDHLFTPPPNFITKLVLSIVPT